MNSKAFRYGVNVLVSRIDSSLAHNIKCAPCHAKKYFFPLLGTSSKSCLLQYNTLLLRRASTSMTDDVVVTSDDKSTTTKNIEDTKQQQVVRLSKWISIHGNTISRREAERLIRDGQVTLCGSIVTSSAIKVPLDVLVNSNNLVVAKKVIKVNSANVDTVGNNNNIKTRVWIAHKLNGELVTENDPIKNRPTIMERLKQQYFYKNKHKKHKQQHIKSIGRLDMNTEGLLLLTNNGQYARDMEIPINKIHRTYRVRVHGIINFKKLDAIRRGVRTNDNNIQYSPMHVEVDDDVRKQQRGRSSTSTNHWIRITCTEGKNRQIRNVLKHLNLQVTRLIRISYGDYNLQTIPPGGIFEVPYIDVTKHKRRGHLFRYDKNKFQYNNNNTEKATPVQWIRRTT